MNDLQKTDFPYEVIEIVNYMFSIYTGHDGRLYVYVAAGEAPDLGEWSTWIEKLIYLFLDHVARRYAQNTEKSLIAMKPILIGDISEARN